MNRRPSAAPGSVVLCAEAGSQILSEVNDTKGPEPPKGVGPGRFSTDGYSARLLTPLSTALPLTEAAYVEAKRRRNL